MTAGYQFAPGANNEPRDRFRRRTEPGSSVETLQLRPKETAEFRAHSPVAPSLLAGVAPAPPAISQRFLEQWFGPGVVPPQAGLAAVIAHLSQPQPAPPRVALPGSTPPMGVPSGGYDGWGSYGPDEDALAQWLRMRQLLPQLPEWPTAAVLANVGPPDQPPASPRPATPLPRFTIADNVPTGSGGPVTA